MSPGVPVVKSQFLQKPDGAGIDGEATRSWGCRTVWLAGGDVAFEVEQCALGVTEAIVQHAAFTDQGGVPWFDHEQQIYDETPRCGVSLAAEDGVKVVEHALEQLAACDGGEERFRAGTSEVHAAQPGQELRTVEACALVKRVDIDRRLRATTADEKVARVSDAVAGKSDTLCHFYVDKRKSDGNARAAGNDLVQIAISRVVIGAGVPAKAEDGEELMVDGLREDARVRRLAGLFADRFSDEVQFAGDIVRIRKSAASHARDRHRSAEQIDFVIWPGDGRLELPDEWGLHRGQYSGAAGCAE